MQNVEWPEDEDSRPPDVPFQGPTGIWTLVALLLFQQFDEYKKSRDWVLDTAGHPSLLGEILVVCTSHMEQAVPVRLT